jgi:hypothetical protein
MDNIVCILVLFLCVKTYNDLVSQSNDFYSFLLIIKRINCQMITSSVLHDGHFQTFLHLSQPDEILRRHHPLHIDFFIYSIRQF